MTFVSGPPWSDYVDDETGASSAAAGAGSTIPLAMDADVHMHYHWPIVGTFQLSYRLARLQG
jgi:hypothetical protein